MEAPAAIALSLEEREEYARLCRSGMTAVRLKERLAIILLAEEGLNNGEISERLPANAHKAGQWRNRFSDEGLAGSEKELYRGVATTAVRIFRSKLNCAGRFLKRQLTRSQQVQRTGARGHR